LKALQIRHASVRVSSIGDFHVLPPRLFPQKRTQSDIEMVFIYKIRRIQVRMERLGLSSFLL